MKRISILLITVALIAGMVGCGGESYTLTISSTDGGSVTDPGEDTFTYAEGTEVDLVAEAEEGYRFVEWTGDVGDIDDVNDATTTITMNGHYSITANFGLEIRDWYDLDTVRDNLDSHHFLVNDLDSTTAGYMELASPTANQGKGWQPIGSWATPFTGNFDGQGYEIHNLFINRPDENIVGLFGSVDEGGHIEDIWVVSATVTGHVVVGGLVGRNYGIVYNSYSTGSVTGGEYVGGLVGANDGGTVSNSYSTSSVTGEGFFVGGLVGHLWESNVSNSYATGSVTGFEYVGGLVGHNHFSSVSNSYSTGNVTGNRNVGGLVGYIGHIWEGNVSNSYFTGSVTGFEDVGGLVGDNYLGSTISNSYSTGTVIGNEDVGGLVGDNYFGSTISNSYSTGTVIGNEDVGGLVGENDGTVSDSFWDTETSGQSDSAGGTGKNTTEMQDIDTFSAWDITTVANPSTRNPSYIWNIVDTVTYPFLSWEP